MMPLPTSVYIQGWEFELRHPLRCLVANDRLAEEEEEEEA